MVAVTPGTSFRAGREGAGAVAREAVAAPGAGPGRTVLVADDDPDILALMAVKLRVAGYEVVEAADGDEAVARAVETVPDLIVLDVSMPGRSGIDVCRQVRDHPRLRGVPVIMLTARDEATATTLGYLAGADLYLGKPFSPREVVRHVDDLLVRHAPRRAAALERPEEAAAVEESGPGSRRRLFGRRRAKESTVWY